MLDIGVHLVTERIFGLYTHHGIYIGNGEVIHFSGRIIETISLFKFLKGKPFATRDYKDKKNLNPPSKIIEKANSGLNEKGYSLLYNNCEHFADWCRINEMLLSK
ncbi:hypothetical protein A0126_11685 [Exiguobacterium sp. N4-1P]|uniref:lecithin retinol acyltransferase family protein n=1 Tax=Exiguobacterium sp. N4-1P TaxID=2051906 RepID=UPI000B588D00|nr:lecithin retinol acyltransferase family protein [Exiguobacterium sp. N4-1P]ASI36212.1 hypothetical protein A0126_11685 [Exiguobacterium sp. N4-1P]